MTVPLSRANGRPDWDEPYSFSISRVYDYIHGIYGLPPSNLKDVKVELALSFNDLIVPIESDSDGVYKFIEPLPVSLLPYVDMKIQINTSILKDQDKIILDSNKFPYSTITAQYSKSKIALDKNSIVKISIRSYEQLPNKNKIMVDLNATISNGTIVFTQVKI
jgi:hypothetical protein